MNNPRPIQDELKELNSHLPLPGPTPFTVPEGYFEGLAAAVMARIRLEGKMSAEEEIAGLSPLLAGISRKTPFSLPEHYFESNIDDAVALTAEVSSPILAAAGKEMPFELPSGYFEAFPATMLQKVRPQGAKVVTMGARKWFRMAAAAAVAGIITLSGVAYFNRTSGVKLSDPVAVELKEASTEELNAFIKTTDVAPAEDRTTAQGNEVKQLLKDVSDKELEAFLETVPADDDEAYDLN